jgi:hypothetical protein
MGGGGGEFGGDDRDIWAGVEFVLVADLANEGGAPFAGFEVGENAGAIAAHFLGILAHHVNSIASKYFWGEANWQDC